MSMLLWLAWSGCTPHAPLQTAAPPPWVGQRTQPAELPAVVAVVNGQPLTTEELRASAGPAWITAEASLAEAQRDALDQLVVETLIHQQAKGAGKDDQAWLLDAVAGRYSPVTDAEVTAFYNENRAQIAEPIDQIRESIRQYLLDQRVNPLIGEVVSQLRRNATVQDHLPRYRVAVDAAGPRLGPVDAPVQIVEFSDFQCPYCAKAAEVMRQVVEVYGDRVSLTYRHLPLSFHAQAFPAAEASKCAEEQGRFWEFHDALFADQPAWASGMFDGVAERARVDVSRLHACVASHRYQPAVAQDAAVAERVGASGTPAFFVNGIVLGGAQPFEAFAAIIDAELADRSVDPLAP